MKAHRFMPVHWVDGFDIASRAKDAGFRVALEDSGEVEPWEEDLTGDVMLVVGGRDGIPKTILESQIPWSSPHVGFVPSYNLWPQWQFSRRGTSPA